MQNIAWSWYRYIIHLCVGKYRMYIYPNFRDAAIYTKKVTGEEVELLTNLRIQSEIFTLTFGVNSVSRKKE